LYHPRQRLRIEASSSYLAAPLDVLVIESASGAIFARVCCSEGNALASKRPRRGLMSDTHGTGSQSMPPHVQLIQMAAASWVAATVYAAAKLGLADHLAGGPKSAVELAGSAGVHAPSLHRLMRTLAGLGILTERERQQFALTPLGDALKTEAPGSARATLMAFCGRAFWHSWEEFVYSLETGKTGFERANGMPLFEYLAQNPGEASYFSEAMVGFHGSEPPAVAEAYDFSGVKSIV
jgi:hypothetical protein